MPFTNAKVEDFIKFVKRTAEETPDHPIDHMGGWSTCAVGDFIREVLKEDDYQYSFGPGLTDFLNYNKPTLDDDGRVTLSEVYTCCNSCTLPHGTYSSFSKAIQQAYKEDKANGW